MRKQRNGWEIIMRILDTATISVSVTDIMYEVRVPHAFLQKYSRQLTDKGLLAETVEGRFRTYAITPKGSKLLKHLKQVKRLLG